MKKLKAILFFVVLFSAKAFSQTSELILEKGVAAHKGIDEVYRQFSESYRKLDAEMVINLYTETAAYLPPDSEILLGQDKVRGTFTPFFESVKKDGRAMTISFQIFQRRVEKNMGYDVGIYTLRSFENGKEVGGASRGKFVVIAVKEKDGKWRFQLDTYNDLPRPRRTDSAPPKN